MTYLFYSFQVLSTSGQVIANQIVVNNAALAQQLATGKAQLATIGGQQVLLRSATAGNLVQLKPGNANILIRNSVTPTKSQTGLLRSKLIKKLNLQNLILNFLFLY